MDAKGMSDSGVALVLEKVEKTAQGRGRKISFI